MKTEVVKPTKRRRCQPSQPSRAASSKSRLDPSQKRRSNTRNVANATTTKVEFIRYSPVPDIFVEVAKKPWRPRQVREPFSPSYVHPIKPSYSAEDTTSTIRPISELQLINEVKGIYAGLVMVEKKCVDIVSQQSESSKRLSDQHWEALVALHRTLLQEHHDFFLASQHPTASANLKQLAMKYAMPARMWRHGIHTFLELLRHRLPDSLDHMLSFVHLAYSMTALLEKSVPDFIDTWIECLGDLARYRMAMEKSDWRDRESWSKAARMWYNEAADKTPNVGRIWYRTPMMAQLDILKHLLGHTSPADDFQESPFRCPSINGWRRHEGRSKSWKPSLYMRLMVARNKTWHNAQYTTGSCLLPITLQSPHRIARLVLPFNKKACFQRRSRKNARKPSMRRLLESGLEDVLHERDGRSDASLELVAQTESRSTDWCDSFSSHGFKPSSLLKHTYTGLYPQQPLQDITIIHESFQGTIVASVYRVFWTIRQEKHFAVYHVVHLITDESYLLTSIAFSGISDRERQYRIKLLKRLQNRVDHIRTHLEHGTAWIVQDSKPQSDKYVQTGPEERHPSSNMHGKTRAATQQSTFLKRGTKQFEEHFPPAPSGNTLIWPAKVTWPTIRPKPTTEKREKKRTAQRDRRFRKRQAKREENKSNPKKPAPDKPSVHDFNLAWVATNTDHHSLLLMRKYTTMSWSELDQLTPISVGSTRFGRLG